MSSRDTPQAMLARPFSGRSQTTFLIAGAGVRPHAPVVFARHVDVAPTIAALLGVRAPSGAQGRVLWEALR